MENVKLEEGFNQVCVWHATCVGKDRIDEFVKHMKEKMNVNVQYLEEVENTDGRNDLLFAIHDDDINKFAIPRLNMGIRWIEDCLANGNRKVWPSRLTEYACW